MGSPDLLFNLRNLFYLGAYQAAINNSDVPGLEADAAAERDAIIFRFYIALGSYQLVVSEIDLSAVTSLQAVKLLALYLTGDRVLGTATREEIQSHPWHKFTIILLLRHLVTVVTVGTANQFAFSFLTVSSPTPPEWMNECFFDSHENLNFFLGLEWNLYLLRASGILLLYLRCHEAHLCDPAGTEAVPPAAAPGLVCGVLQSFGLVVNESSAIQSLAMSCS